MSLTGCLWGTGTGNPEKQPASDSNSLFTLRSYVCVKLTNCYNLLSANDCQAGMGVQTNIDTELGLSEGQYASYEEVEDAVYDGVLSPHLAAVSQCADDIYQLSCEDLDARDVYDPLKSNPYENLKNIFSPACEGIFGGVL